MAKPTLLTVDDDPNVLKAIERDLRARYGEKYRVLRANSGGGPGNYLVEIRPQGFDKEQILEKFSEDDLQASDHDYQRSYWPGGGGFDSVLPVQVMSGGSSSVGTMRARKVDFHRIHLSIPASGCPGEKVQISAEMRIG